MHDSKDARLDGQSVVKSGPSHRRSRLLMLILRKLHQALAQNHRSLVEDVAALDHGRLRERTLASAHLAPSPADMPDPHLLPRLERLVGDIDDLGDVVDSDGRDRVDNLARVVRVLDVVGAAPARKGLAVEQSRDRRASQEGRRTRIDRAAGGRSVEAGLPVRRKLGCRVAQTSQKVLTACSCLY